MMKSSQYEKLKSFSAGVVLMCIILLSPGSGNGQSRKQQVEVNPLIVHFLSFPSENTGKSRAVILMQISYDQMRFLKRDDKFVAKYEFSAEILDGSDNIVERKYWDQEFVLTDFRETIERSVVFLDPLEFELGAGFYKYFVEMTDTDSRKSFSRRDSKIFPPYWSNIVGFSDLVYSYGTEEKQFLTDVIPYADGIEVDFDKGFSIQFQLFSADLQPLDFSWKIVDFFNNARVVKMDSIRLHPDRHTIDISIPIHGNSIPTGSYLLQSQVRNSEGRKDDLLQRIKFTWVNRPLSSFDIEKSIGPMKYIIPEENQDITPNMTLDEKRVFFDEFWNERDPTPDTQKNELLEEYFKRVEYAIEKFSYRGTPGWDTPRGRILCLYGIPDTRVPSFLNIQRYPQEVWTYNSARKRFVFADYRRNGNFVLESEENIIR